MKKKEMRLVAMIEKIKSMEEKYEATNFLPDIKVKYTGGKTFEIEENPDYIKIPYAEGIDDLTVIVGENGVGKTRLVNDILSMSADKIFVFYDVANDRCRYYTQTDEDWVSQIKFSAKKSGSKHYTTRPPKVSETNIVKFSTSIELSSLGRELNSSKDISTSRLLTDSELYYVNLNDMKKQIGFLKSAIINKFEILRFIKSKKIIINKDDSLKYYKTTLDIDEILAPRKLSGTNDNGAYSPNNKYSPKKQLLQNLYDVLIYTVIEVREVKLLEKPTGKKGERDKFKLIVKEQSQEIPACYNFKKNLGIKDWDDFLSRWDNDEGLQKAWAKANAYLDYFEHPDDSPLDKGKRKLRLGRDIHKDAIIRDFSSLERIGGNYRRILKSLIEEIEKIEEPKERKTVANPETFDIFYDKYYSILELVEKLKMEKLERPTINSYISPFYKLSIDKLLSTITFSWDGLSSGELALLNLFGRLYSIKKELKANNILLLLDEVDLGLHPEWQRRWISVALPIIQEIFKDKHIQIIMTTHSPIMLSDIYAENVIMLKKGNNGQRIIEKNQVTTFGQNIHDLYRDSFFLESTRGEHAKIVIDTVIKTLSDSKDERLEKQYIYKFLKEKPSGERLKKVIDSIGENIVSQKLIEMYNKIYVQDIDLRINLLEKELKKLKEEKEGATKQNI